MPIENKANKLDYKMNWLYKSNYTHIDSVAFNATNANNIAKQKHYDASNHISTCPVMSLFAPMTTNTLLNYYNRPTSKTEKLLSSTLFFYGTSELSTS